VETRLWSLHRNHTVRGSYAHNASRKEKKLTMDNTPILPQNDAFVASSYALKQSTPLPSHDNIHPRKPVSKTPSPVGTLLSEVRGKVLRWLWQRRLPLGKLTTLDGDLCLGKSMLALDIAARVSSGQEMPDGTPGIDGGAGVVLIAPDDGLADTILPRLQRAGADLSRIVSIGTILATDAQTGHPYRRPFRLPDDRDLLLEVMARVHAKLVLIDPLISLLDPKEASKDPEMRTALAPLQMLIEYTEAACLIVGHQPKAGRSRPRTGEARASLSAADSGLIILKDPDDESKRVLAHIKSKLSAQAAHLSFSIASDEDAGDEQPSIRWLGTCSHTLQELLNPPASGAMQSLGIVRQEILEVLELSHPTALSVKALAEALPEISNSNLRRTLKRMTADRQIQQSARGTYGAFPPSPPSSEQPEQPQQEQSSHMSQSIKDEEEHPQLEQSSHMLQPIRTDKELSQMEQSSHMSQSIKDEEDRS
jgi:hypothetical protein